MGLLILSFIAGVLTVAAPCILPLLPITIGGSLVGNSKDKNQQQWLRPAVIAISLAISIVIFTLALKSTTLLLNVPQLFWQILSGSIIMLLGLSFLWPALWEKLVTKLNLSSKPNAALSKAYQRKDITGAILIGAALGPVFSSCSPTYALIVAAVLPASFLQGLLYLAAYAVGLSSTLLLIAYLGQAFTAKLKFISNPHGWFKRVMGIVFIAVGLAVVFGLDKSIQAYVLEQGWYDPISSFEQKLR